MLHAALLFRSLAVFLAHQKMHYKVTGQTAQETINPVSIMLCKQKKMHYAVKYDINF